MQPYTRENILSPMLKIVIIRIDFTGLTSVRSFVNHIKTNEHMRETFRKMLMLPRRNMEINFTSKDVEDGQLPLTEIQKSTLYRFYDCTVSINSKATLDIEPESITLKVDCQNDYNGSKTYSDFMGWIIKELPLHDPYVTINRLGVRKIDLQIINKDESIDEYFNEKYTVAQSWRYSPLKTKSILTELLEIENISFNVIQLIDHINDGRERLIYDVDAFLKGNKLQQVLDYEDVANFLYHDMQDRMFYLFLSVASENYLDKCKLLKEKQNG